jgi:hypothetical protein
MATIRHAKISVNSEISREVEILREDYERVREKPFQHFFCPVLLDDCPGELCMGHVVNQSIPNCSRERVVQRKDIDGFFGSLFESKFSAVINAKPKDVHDAITDEKLRRLMPFEVKLDGSMVQHYHVKGDKATKDPLVCFRDSHGKILNLALKVSDETMISGAGRLEIEMSFDIAADATATLLKAAHLTLFKMLGCEHVFSPGGYDLAKILQKFYLTNRDLSRGEQVKNGKEYFAAFSGMIIPVKGYNRNVVKGTIEDSRLLVCIGTSGAWFAVGVLVRIDNRMFVVLLAPDNESSMDTYTDFVKSMSKPSFNYKLIEFSPASESEIAHWKIDHSEPYKFDPNFESSSVAALP